MINLTNATKNNGASLPHLQAHSCDKALSLGEGASVEDDFEGIIGRSPGIKALCQQIKVVAPTDSTALILGETGTGKELFAQAIHNLSPRRKRPFVKVNCAAIPAGLIESELFGHERGAFTGAIGRRTGRFEMAHGGTLFLDEIGDIPLELQPKLLRVLQEQEFERVGAPRPLRSMCGSCAAPAAICRAWLPPGNSGPTSIIASTFSPACPGSARTLGRHSVTHSPFRPTLFQPGEQASDGGSGGNHECFNALPVAG